MDTLLYESKGLLGRLSSDILGFFLNYPSFETEKILDSLIQTRNNENAQEGIDITYVMPPSDLVLAPTNPTFSRSLKYLKDLINTTRQSENGFPDGIRITINAIESNTSVPDMQINSLEQQTADTVNKYIDSQYKRDYQRGPDHGGEDLHAEYLIFDKRRSTQYARGNKSKTKNKKSRKKKNKES